MLTDKMRYRLAEEAEVIAARLHALAGGSAGYTLEDAPDLTALARRADLVARTLAALENLQILARLAG